jgi:methylenetetrahydrofolate reductase (NADPH)
MVAADLSQASRISELLSRSRYEVIPLEGIEEQVLAHVPRDVTVTVTASPTRGLEPTLALTGSLTRHGYSVVPHLSARHVADASEAQEIAERLRRDGVRDVFVVAGDAEEAHGTFHGAIDLLEALDGLGRPFPDVGITGYPESHPFIDDETTIAAMAEKARHATYIVSQVCFDPSITARWIEDVWERGTRLPIYVGVPGVVSRMKLARVSTRIGIGDSLRFLRKNGSFASRLLRGGFSPDPLLDGLGPVLDGEKVAGFHVFTFNDVEDTERWRRARLHRPAPAVSAATPAS